MEKSSISSFTKTANFVRVANIALQYNYKSCHKKLETVKQSFLLHQSYQITDTAILWKKVVNLLKMLKIKEVMLVSKKVLDDPFFNLQT